MHGYDLQNFNLNLGFRFREELWKVHNCLKVYIGLRCIKYPPCRI